MKPRSFLAWLVLANYLFLVGTGCVSRPEQDSFLVLIQTQSAESHHYESRRYMRSEGIEAFMAEALTTRYQNTPDNQNHLLLSVTPGVDSHSLPDHCQFQVPFFYEQKGNEPHYTMRPLLDIALAVYSPPDNYGLA